jgi:fructose/tagatose bisphosphate aldolase
MQLTERNNMKATKFIIERQQDALVEVIQFLDSHGHSDTEVRETVDRILNSRSFDEAKEDSDNEIKQAEEVLKRYEYAD